MGALDVRQNIIAETNYIDDYGSCCETFSTLRIYHEEDPPSEVTKILGVQPHDQQTKGVTKPNRRRPAKINGWFFSSEGKVDSLDCRRHIDWLMYPLIDKREAFQNLLSRGYEIYISCFWVSRSGTGGPTLSPRQMKVLVDLGIEVSWDIYFASDSYSAEPPDPVEQVGDAKTDPPS